MRVDRPRDLVRKYLSVPSDAPLVISIGALTWEKDPLRHLAVTSRLLDTVPGLVHVFVGEGPLEDRLRSAIDESGRRESVRVLGSRDDVPDLLNAADALLLASRIEGMPGVAIEAAFLGVPVVGYAVAGTAEVVVDGVTGSLARPGDEDVLAERVGALLMDPTLRHQMGLEARRRADGFAIDGVADRYLEVYQRVLEGADLCVARGGAVMQEAFRDRANCGEPFPGLVSVVIPVRNGADVLPLQLEALARQTYRGEWEVVVADHDSSDATVDVARGWSDRLPLRVVEVPRRPGSLGGFPRSVGAAEARGDLIVTCDADDEATPEWVEEMVKAAREHDVVRGSLDRRTLNDSGGRTLPTETEAATPVLDSSFLPFASSSNCAVRTSVLREIGAWHDSFHAQDKEFSWRAQLAGFDLAVAPDAVMRKRDRATPWGSARQVYHYGISDAQLFRAFRHRGMPRSSVLRAAGEWGELVVGSPSDLTPLEDELASALGLSIGPSRRMHPPPGLLSVASASLRRARRPTFSSEVRYVRDLWIGSDLRRWRGRSRSQRGRERRPTLPPRPGRSGHLGHRWCGTRHAAPEHHRYRRWPPTVTERRRDALDRLQRGALQLP